jgi:hypothetical protein
MSRGATFTPAHLHVVAEIIRAIDEPDVRQVMANHFGQAFNRRNTGFSPSMWAGATGGTLMGPTRLDGDSAGVPADLTVAPRTDLMDCTLQLWPPDPTMRAGGVTVIGKDYAANGRVFKWLQGQVQLARRKIHG